MANLALWLSLLVAACNVAKVEPFGADAIDSGEPPLQGAIPPVAQNPPAPLYDANGAAAQAPADDMAGADSEQPVPPAADANGAAEDPNRPLTGPLVRLQGRFEAADGNGLVRFAWPASAMLTRILGTGVAISLSDDGNMVYQGNVVHNHYSVFVDDVLTKTFEVTPDANVYIAAQNLPYGDHTVRVVKRTEAQMGSGIFAGFVPLGNGKLLPAPLPKARQIEFIGDSITAGYGADGNVPTGNGCPFTAATENATVTYAAQTAAALGAEYVAIGFSGKGMVQNNDCVGDPVSTLPVLYPRTIPRRADSVYAFASWTPQVVVMNLGTNDYKRNNGCSVPPSTLFVAGADAMLRTVRSKYPDAAIFVTIGPTLGPPDLAVAQNNLQAAVAQRVAAGDSNVYYVALAQSDGKLGYGCAGHPNVATHAVVAKVIVEAIKQRLAW